MKGTEKHRKFGSFGTCNNRGSQLERPRFSGVDLESLWSKYERLDDFKILKFIIQILICWWLCSGCLQVLFEQFQAKNNECYIKFIFDRIITNLDRLLVRP